MKMLSNEKLKDGIVEVGKRLYKRNYVASNNGNISCRLGKNKILITPAGMSKGFMKPEDLVITDMKGKVLEGSNRPSSEILMHIIIYKMRTDVQSICHAHPIFATAFACCERSINSPLLSDIIISMGKIAKLEYAPPGSKQLSETFKPYIKKYNAFLLSNHGAVTVGNSITSACYRMESLEQYAHICFVVKQLGSEHSLDREQVRDLVRLREKFNVQKDLNEFE